MTAKQGHLAFLTQHGLRSLGKIGREETFTGVLVATLLNPLSTPAALEGLGLSSGLRLDRLHTAVEPIDLVLELHDTKSRQHVCLVEVKWQGTNSNPPGWTSEASGWSWHDQPPSQLDRAHQMAAQHATAVGACVVCAYPNVCPQDGCLRGCTRHPSGVVAHQWGNQRPKVYPSPQQAQRGLSAVLDQLSAPVAQWHFKFLDYDDRTAQTALPGGICNGSWTPAPMSGLAAVIQRHYLAARAVAPATPQAAALEPILQALYSD